MTVETERLTLREGVISSSTSDGEENAGNILLQASDAVELSGRSYIVATTLGEASGNGGMITIETGRLQLADSSFVSPATNSQGRGGNSYVRASESVQLSGSSGLAVGSSGAGDAGDLNIETGQLLAQGGWILANTLGGGRGGNIKIDSNQLILRDGAQVNVSSTGLGAAGNLEVTADSVLLDNGFLAAQTAAGDRGNITVRSRGLILRHGSRITTNAQGTATGGNIFLDTDVLAALENSDISANAQQGSGGRVIINAQGIFGTQFRNQLTPLSDITASSNLGPQFSGIVEINTPDVDPSRGLATEPSGISRGIGANCYWLCSRWRE